MNFNWNKQRLEYNILLFSMNNKNTFTIFLVITYNNDNFQRWIIETATVNIAPI